MTIRNINKAGSYHKCIDGQDNITCIPYDDPFASKPGVGCKSIQEENEVSEKQHQQSNFVRVDINDAYRNIAKDACIYDTEIE